MKRFIIVAVFSIMASATFAQSSYVKWSYEAKKTADKTYDVVITATLDKPWHIYSQTTPDGGPVQTAIVFKTNPLITLNGKPKEDGDLKVIHDKVFGVDVKYFGDKVSFVQALKVKSAAKTNVTGTIQYMICNDNKCLPPTKQPFSVTLQ